MIWLPVVERELRVASRRWRTYWSRVGGAAIALVVVAYMLVLGAAGLPGSTLGRVTFVALCWILFLSALTSGSGATADSLSSERREGTLGLLLLTPLRGRDVVLGKLAASALSSLYRLVAVVPVLALPILLGGVGILELGLSAVLLGVALVFSLSAGMMASAVSREARQSSGLAAVLVLLLVGGPPLAGAVVEGLFRSHGWGSLLKPLSPAAGLFEVTRPLTGSSMGPRWEVLGISVGYTLAWTLLLLALASGRVRHAWRDRPVSDSPRGLRAAWRRWSYGDTRQRQRLRAKLLERNPVFWLCARGRRRSWAVWGFLGACLGVWLVVWAKVGWAVWSDGFTLVLLAAVHLLLAFWIGSESVQFPARQQRDGTWEMMLTTPLREREVVRGQWLALGRLFFRPLGVVLAVDAICLAALVVQPGWEARDRAYALVLSGSALGVFLSTVVALGWIGMWQGMVARSASVATSATLSRGLVLPWFVFGLVQVMLVSAQWRSSLETLILLWTGVFMTADGVWILVARRNLYRKLRRVAAMRYGGDTPETVFAVLGAWYGRWRAGGGPSGRAA